MVETNKGTESALENEDKRRHLLNRKHRTDPVCDKCTDTVLSVEDRRYFSVRYRVVPGGTNGTAHCYHSDEIIHVNSFQLI